MAIDYQQLVQQYILLILISYALGLVILFITANLVAKAARMKNRSYASFYWLTLVFGPWIVGGVVAALPFNLDDPRHPINKGKVANFRSTNNVSDSDTRNTILIDDQR